MTLALTGKSRPRQATLIVAAALGLLGALMLALAASFSASATHVDPVFVAGNPTCSSLGYDNEFKVNNPATTSYSYGSSGTETTPNVAFSGSFTITLGSQGIFSWTSPFPVDAVIAKGGPDANVYHYNPATSSDSNLSTPINSQNDKPFGLSHVSFCWDDIPATNTPTDEPTDTPTDEPTDTPTDEPTETPTDEPTQTPTDEPTATPTDEPTEEPTLAPTEEPTEQPTDEPTLAPTEEPTQVPTEEPTLAPTEEPTEEATIVLPATPEPTEEPTDEPTATNTPEEDTLGEITPGATNTPGAPSAGSGSGSDAAASLAPILLALAGLALIFSGAALAVTRTRS